MFDASLRIAKRSALRPVTVRLASGPLAVTLVGLSTGLLAALLAAQGRVAVALALWLLNRLLDGLDGELARFQGSHSDFGGYVDLLTDLLVYALVPIGLAWSYFDQAVVMSLVFMLAAFYVNAGSWMLLSALIEKRRRATPTHSTSVTIFPVPASDRPSPSSFHPPEPSLLDKY